jgi:hypothetical protein
MRVVRNAKTVSVVAGGVLVVAGCLGVWLAAKLQAGQEGARVIVFTVLFAAAAVIQGVVILSWDRRSKPMALMRAQAADTLPVILPLIMSPDWAHQFLPARCVAPTRRDAATIDIPPHTVSTNSVRVFGGKDRHETLHQSERCNDHMTLPANALSQVRERLGNTDRK